VECPIGFTAESVIDMRGMRIRAIRDQCQGAGVSFFFKQWGGVQKKASGRLLDGREHNEMPGGASDGDGVQVRRKKEGQRQLRVA